MTWPGIEPRSSGPLNFRMIVWKNRKKVSRGQRITFIVCSYPTLFVLFLKGAIFCTRSDLIQIIFKQIRLVHGILKDTTTPGQSEPESNGNEGVLYTLQVSRTGASPLDAVGDPIKIGAFNLILERYECFYPPHTYTAKFFYMNGLGIK